MAVSVERGVAGSVDAIRGSAGGRAGLRRPDAERNRHHAGRHLGRRPGHGHPASVVGDARAGPARLVRRIHRGRQRRGPRRARGTAGAWPPGAECWCCRPTRKRLRPLPICLSREDTGRAASWCWATSAATTRRSTSRRPIEFSGVSPRLNIVALQLNGPLLTGWATGLPDDAFEHDGQLTKRDLRAAALARLLPAPGQLLWDVGAGAGSVGIEWMRAHPTCRAVAVEADPHAPNGSAAMRGRWACLRCTSSAARPRRR